MASFMRLLTAPTADTGGAAIQYHHDEIGSYLFGNVSEGTQRAMTQRKFLIGKIRQIFISGPVNWHTVGGLLGTVLTLADIRAMTLETTDSSYSKGKRALRKLQNDLVIHGGPNLKYTLATARAFIFRKGMPLKINEILSDPRLDNPDSVEPDYSDSFMKVWYVPLFADGFPDSQKSSRKRSHDQMDGDTQSKKPTEQSDADRLIVDEAVESMFNSTWEMDQVQEIPLLGAPRDAKLFIRNDDGELEHLTSSQATALREGPLTAVDRVYVRKPWPGALINNLPPTTPVRQSMCYIARNHDRRGKFKAKEALRLGVPPKENKKLAQGESVTVKDGTVVTPEMVLEPPRAGSGMAIIDIPDDSYVASFLARPEWDNKEIFKNIEQITWNLGPGVVNDHRIQEFMRSHGDVRHSVAAKEVCPNRITYGTAAETAARLHRIDPDRFSLHEFNNVPSQAPPPLVEGSEERLFRPAFFGDALMLAPQVKELDQYFEPNVDLQAALQPLTEETISLAGKAQQTIRDPEFLREIEEAERDIPNRDMEIISLGTGSSTPSKHRNVSSTLIRIPGVGSYMFDCGENTLGSLRRLMGHEGAEDVLKDLRVLWISHVHADHHLGTPSLIRAWRDATQHLTPQPRLLVACSMKMATSYAEYKNVEDFGFDRVVFGVTHDAFGPQRHISLPNEPSGEKIRMAEFGLKWIGACRVDHCFGACATVFEWASKLKVAYSGDCRPSDDFVELAKGATLLIHESTLEDGLEADAIRKKHCTMSEALGVAKRMGARRVLLTHFSQRYADFPAWDQALHNIDSEGEGERPVTDKAIILMAFDLMRVKLGEFKQAAQFLPAIGSMFREELAAEVGEETSIGEQPKQNELKLGGKTLKPAAVLDKPSQASASF